MKHRNTFLTGLLWALAAIFLIIGCAKAPYTGRNQLILISQSQEMALGNQAAQEVLDEEKLSKDPQYTKPVTQVGQRIAKAADRKDFQWAFYTIDKPKTPNAFALPGGKIFVYTGLFKYAKNRAQLATVMAHEVGHVIARHGGERLSTGILAQVGQELAVAAVGGYSAGTMEAFRAAFGLGLNVGVILPFSRSQEYEADRIGLILMSKAGYDPHAALEFWQNMSKAGGSKPPEFLSTHPVTSNRIAAIKQLMPEAMTYYKKK